jgi:formyltetrahydrofolate hydrolase
MKNSAILLVACPDRKGEVASIADFVYRHNGNILQADEHADEESGLFLMRSSSIPKISTSISPTSANTSRRLPRTFR